jgi:ABC-type dipeptide/oligopeptide/nickel transport system ATPase component
MSVAPAAQEVLLDVVGLETSFETGAGLVRAVDGVSLRVPR